MDLRNYKQLGSSVSPLQSSGLGQARRGHVPRPGQWPRPSSEVEGRLPASPSRANAWGPALSPGPQLPEQRQTWPPRPSGGHHPAVGGQRGYGQVHVAGGGGAAQDPILPPQPLPKAGWITDVAASPL
jgi:hypothetical protein